MTDLSTVLDAVIRAIEQSGKLPGITDYLTHEGDDYADAAETFPAIEAHPVAVDRVVSDTERVGYVTDDAGDRIGLIYDVNYTADIQLDVYATAGGDYDATRLATAMKRALFQYDGSLRDDPLPEGDGTGLTEATGLTVNDGERRDQLAGTPALRRYLQRITVRYFDRINSVEEYGPVPAIKHVEYPRPGDLIENVGDGEWTIESDETRYSA